MPNVGNNSEGNYASIELSATVRQSERKRYTVLALLGDVGGFNDGIIIFPTLFLTYYSQIVFQSAISKEFLTKSKKERNRKKGRNTLKSRLASD